MLRMVQSGNIIQGKKNEKNLSESESTVPINYIPGCLDTDHKGVLHCLLRLCGLQCGAGCLRLLRLKAGPDGGHGGADVCHGLVGGLAQGDG